MIHMNKNHTNAYLYHLLRDIIHATSLLSLGYARGVATAWAIHTKNVEESYRYMKLVDQLVSQKEKELKDRGWI